MWRWFWRAIGLLALILSSLSCFFLYTLWKAAAIQPVANGKPIASSLDVISLQIDILSITMAAVGFALAVIGLFGYQSIKDVAMERAERAADAIATKAVALHMENIRETHVAGLRGGDGPLPIEPEDVNPADGGE